MPKSEFGKKFSEIAIPSALSKSVYAAERHFLDKEFARWTLYKPLDYVKDLIKAGYVRAVATDTDDEIATAIMGTGGYKFSGGPSNLVGDSKLTATTDTYMAAVGIKVPAWQFPSTWASAITGILLMVEAEYNLTGSDFTTKHEIGIGLTGVNLVVEGTSRMFGIGSTKYAPTGLDVAPGTVQHLSPQGQGGANIQAYQALTRENQALKGRLSNMQQHPAATLAQPAIPQVRTQDVPQVRTQDVPQTPDVKSIKDKFGIMEGEPHPTVVQGGGYRPGPGYVTPLESMKKEFGLMSFEA